MLRTMLAGFLWRMNEAGVSVWMSSRRVHESLRPSEATTASLGVEVEEHTRSSRGRRGSSAAAKSARLMPEKRRAASAPRVEIFAVQLGSEGVFLGVLSHEVVVPVLIGDGDVEVVGVDVEFEGLFGDFLDGLLNGLGVAVKSMGPSLSISSRVVWRVSSLFRKP